MQAGAFLIIRAPGDELARLPTTKGRTVPDQVGQVLLTFFFHVINI